MKPAQHGRGVWAGAVLQNEWSGVFLAASDPAEPSVQDGVSTSRPRGHSMGGLRRFQPIKSIVRDRDEGTDDRACAS